MGQKASRNHHYFQSASLGAQNQILQEPIKFQYFSTKKPERQFGFKSVLCCVKSVDLKTPPGNVLTSPMENLMKSEERKRRRRLREESWRRTNSEPNLRSARVRGRSRSEQRKHTVRFGYDIDDVDEFLCKVSILFQFGEENVSCVSSAGTPTQHTGAVTL